MRTMTQVGAFWWKKVLRTIWKYLNEYNENTECRTKMLVLVLVTDLKIKGEYI